MCNLKSAWESMLLVHIFLPLLKKSAERSGAVQELHQLRSARAEMCPEKDWVNTGPWTGSTGSGTTRRQQKTPSLHTCLPRSFSRGPTRISDTTWAYLRKSSLASGVPPAA